MSTPHSGQLPLPPLQRGLLFVYSHLYRRGFFESWAGRRIFRPLYFGYKSLLEDPFRRLANERPALFQNGHILDVGANIGYTTWVFSRVVSSGYRVYAFEPEARNFQALHNLCRERHLENRVTPVRAAVGDREANVELWVNSLDQTDHRLTTPDFKGDPGQARDTQSVPMISLDQFVTDIPKPATIAFIKMDIQGYEGPAVRGMSKVLDSNPQAAIAMEYCRSKTEILGFDPDEFLHVFRNRGYTMYSLTRSRWISPIPYDAIESLTRGQGYADLLFIKTPL